MSHRMLLLGHVWLVLKSNQQALLQVHIHLLCPAILGRHAGYSGHNDYLIRLLYIRFLMLNNGVEITVIIRNNLSINNKLNTAIGITLAV